MKSIYKQMVTDISTSLLGVLFHCEEEKRKLSESKNLKLYQKECMKAYTDYKYRVHRSRVEFENAMSTYRSMSRALEQVVSVLLKNDFQITSAVLARTRFILKLQRAGLDFEGTLSFNFGNIHKEVALSVFKRVNDPSTCVFRVKYNVKQGLVSSNKMIQGLLKAIE